MKIALAVNAGSSSVKVSVYSISRQQAPRKLAEGQVSGLTAPPARLSYERDGVSVSHGRDVGSDVQGQDDAFRLLLHTVVEDGDLHEIKTRDDIAVLAHRVVHGGDYKTSQVIDSKTLHHIKDLSDLAPLHNGAALNIIRTCVEDLPRSTNVACFDTQFHATVPEHVYTYPIDREMARRNRLRKYGFHGISYSFITRAVAEFLHKSPDGLSIIALHLGSGASACAVRQGKSVDTTMGLTPVSGLPGATRSGSVDPSLVFHCVSDVGKLSPASTADLHISRAEAILNKECGWKALAGTTDFGEIVSSDEPSHRLALDLFVDRICAAVGSYYVALRGRVDALVFAGGIGEKSHELRSRVLREVACLGFGLDERRNRELPGGPVKDIGADGARHGVLVCETDEQFEMARMCADDSQLW